MWGLYETIALAIKAFGISASMSGETEEEQLTSKEIGFTMVLGVGLAVVLFIVLPAVVTNFAVGSASEQPFVWNVVDGVLRLVAFFVYIWAVTRLKDIQRVFAYHGAEHKTIHAYEHGLPLETETIQKWETLHVRCGTSFLLMVMVVALLVFSLVPVKSIVAGLGLGAKAATLLFNIAIRIVLLPLIAGLAYEVTGSGPASVPTSRSSSVLLWPGLQLQRLTTREPDDSMVEVAVAAMQAVVAREDREKAGDHSPADEPADHAEEPVVIEPEAIT